MKCPYCRSELRKHKTKYKCSRCYKEFTYQELQILEDEEYLSRHAETTDIMKNNGGVGGNY